MNKHLRIELDDAATKLVERQLETGEYASAEDVIRAGLQMMDDERERIAFIRAALDEGEASGPAGPLDVDAFLVEMRAKYAPNK